MHVEHYVILTHDQEQIIPDVVENRCDSEKQWAWSLHIRRISNVVVAFCDRSRCVDFAVIGEHSREMIQEFIFEVRKE